MGKENKMHNVPGDVLNVNIKTLRLCGLWNSFGPERKFNRIYNIFSWSLVIVLLIQNSSQLLDIYENWGDLNVFTIDFSVIFTYGAAIIKQVGFLLFSQRIYRLVYSLRDGKLSPTSNWTQEQTENSSWYYYYLGFGTLGSLVLSSVRRNIFYEVKANSTEIHERVLPYRAEFPFDYREDGYYELAYTFQIIVILFGPTVNIGLDTMYTSLIIQSCGQFKILNNSLRKLKDRAIKMLQEETPDNRCKNWTNNFNNSVNNDNNIDSATKDTPLSNTTILEDMDNGMLEKIKQTDEQFFSEYCCEHHLKIKFSECLRDCILHHQQILK
ncbi:hypothetical protein L9F63_007145 [Diploptera punctata]|uniref:Odorant receptor n=1 Tax=Diploptera punctata TaxID=6984 RepID=A0AAD7Z939_DIPPU|nr:hypothetical protein L9F63_007145 [Diploptera punctata]